MQHNQEDIIMLTILIYGFTLCVLVSSDTPNSSDDVEVQLLDNQNAPLVATLDMSKANKRVKQFVSDTIEAKMKNIEDTVKSKQFVSDALEEKIKTIENTVKSKQFVSDALEAKMKTIEDTVKSKQFLSNAVEAKMKNLEVNLQSQMAYFERNLTDQLTEYINEIVGKIDGENETCIRRPLDCKDVKTKKGNGIYKIYPNHSELGFDVYCDYEIDNGGWTVFQRRINGKTDFYRGWEAYENGFGDLEAEFWLGNRKINELTSQGKYELRVDMSDFNGNKLFAKYSSFLVGNVTTKYKLKVGGYSGNSGDSMTYSNGMSFSTKDRDNDLWSPNCAVNRYGAWWYNSCTFANLNGQYAKGGKSDEKGLYWLRWKTTYYSMKSTVMMIRKLN